MKNRTNLKVDIAAWTATHDLEATHKPDVTEIIDSLISRVDVTDSDTITGSTYEVDFDDVDYFVLTLKDSDSNTISFTNISQGEVKWLLLDNAVNETFSFSGVVDETISLAYLSTLDVVFYLVYNKDGNIHTKPMTKDITNATEANALTGTDDEKYMTALATKYVTNHGHKILSNAESYTLADGVGTVEIPSGVSGGTISIPAPASAYTGRRFTVYSSGGSGVNITTIGTIISNFTANYVFEAVNNGTSWVQLIYQSRT